MPGGPDSFLEVALEYRNQGIETTFDFLYDEWRRRYVPPHLDPHSDHFVVPTRPKPVYRPYYPKGCEPAITGRACLFGFITFALLLSQCFQWWDGNGPSLRANLCFYALVCVTFHALFESISI